MQVFYCLFFSLFFSSLLLASFFLGYTFKKTNEDKEVSLTKENAQAIKEMSDWINYRG